MVLKTSMILSGQDYGNGKLSNYQIEALKVEGLNWGDVYEKMIEANLAEDVGGKDSGKALKLNFDVHQDRDEVQSALSLDDQTFNRVYGIIERALATDREDPRTVGFSTLKGLIKAVPAEVPAIVFLSGGQNDDQVLWNMDAVAKASRDPLIFIKARDAVITELEREDNFERANEIRNLEKAPWEISYSFGRGLQRPTLLTWKGFEENWAKAQAKMLATALATQAARLGKLTTDLLNATLVDKAELEKTVADSTSLVQAPDTKGGIDFNASGVNMEIKISDEGFVFPQVDPAMLQKIRIDHLNPRILNITPLDMPMIRQMLGLDEQKNKSKNSEVSYRSLDQAIRLEHVMV